MQTDSHLHLRLYFLWQGFIRGFRLLLKRSEDLDAAGKDSFQVGYGCSVVGYGDRGVVSAFQAVFHFSFVEGAAAAVNDQPVFGEISRKFGSAGELEIRLFFCVLPYPVGQFYGADIVALAVMGAAFTDEDSVIILQSVQDFCAFYDSFQIPFVSCE